MPSTQAPIHPLTSIRFPLSCWVVLYHLTVPNPLAAHIPATIPGFAYRVVRTAYSAVSLFFIISGFSLTYNHDLGAPWTAAAWKRFAATRLTRIYPIYLLGLLLMLPVVATRLAWDYSPARALRDAGSGLLNLGLLQAWLPQTALSWNPPGWSLSAEAFFYLCFPAVGVALWRLRGPRRLLLAAAALWACTLAAPLAAVLAPARGFGDVPATDLLARANPLVSDFVKFNPLLRLPDFCLGILVARLVADLRHGRSPLLGRGPWFYLPGAALILGSLAWAHRIPYPIFHNVLTLPFCALVVFGLALGGGRLDRWLSAPAWVFLGNTSYSIYILHVPMLILIGFGYRQRVHAKLPAPGGTALYLLAVLALSCLTYKCIELPLNRYFRKKIARTF